jgi:hypothetical protein
MRLAKLIILLLLVTLILAGCLYRNLPKSSTTTSGTASYPYYHVWGTVLSYGTEEQDYRGYAIYTYVLFNSNRPDAGTAENQRFDSILKAVLQDIKTRDQGAAAGWPRQETNIFCIPAFTTYLESANALDKYNFDLAMTYLGIIQRALKGNKELFNRLQRRSGPFLISLYEPLPSLQRKATTDMLYVDLTEMSPAVMREVLDSYRQRLDAGPFKNITRLRESLRIAMLNFILTADANIKIVSMALAELKEKQ